MSDPVTQIQADLATAEAALSDATALIAKMVAPTVFTLPAQLDAALAAAKGGETFLLDPSFVYPTPFTLGVPVTLQSSTPVSGRALPTGAMPSFRAGFTTSVAGPVTLLGLEFRHTDPTATIVTLSGGKRVMDGCRVLGDPLLGAKRGIAGNAADVTVIRTYVEDCFGPTPGDDTQAFAAWDSPGPFLLSDSYFSGSSESVLFGGADPSSQANIPQNIHITGCTLTKRPEWQTLKMPNGASVNVKNVIEFKNAINALVENCDISECWGGNGQDGYLMMLTPRNQGGTAPYSCVRNITFTGNRFSSGAGAIAMLGTDNDNPSGPLDTVSISGNSFTGIDPWKYTGADKMILVLANPSNVSITGNTFVGANLGSELYFGGPLPKCVNFNVTGNTWPPALYGVFGASCAVGGVTDATNNAWQTYVASGSLGPNTIQ